MAATTISLTTFRDSLIDHADHNFNSDSARKRLKQSPALPPRASRLNTVNLDSTQSTRTLSTRSRPPKPLMPSRRPQRSRTAARPTYDSAADAAAAATTQVDGYKPREERSWEEFHPDLDVEAKITVFSANEVDGIAPENEDKTDTAAGEQLMDQSASGRPATPQQDASAASPRRRPGRPFKRADAMLTGLGSPPVPRIAPLPAQNPREKLNLPKPSYRPVETFAKFEADRANQVNYVDKTMANVGYQESEIYFGNEKHFVRLVERALKEDHEPSLVLEADQDPEGAAAAPPVTRVEYDMDEQDQEWLDYHNNQRREDGVDNIKPAMFEIIMTQIEKEWHALEKRIPKPNPRPPQTHRPRSSSAAAVSGEPPAEGEEQDSKCAICDDGDCENANAIVFCDGCDLAVHQECYGVPYIPEGQWLCRKCREIGRSTPACIFCPNPDGAFKKTVEGKWAHLLCAVWIPEVTIATKSIMEPIDGVAHVPKSRWKLTCYLCHQKMGACIQCGSKHCYQAFHVTCGRRAKLYLKMKSTHGGPFSIDASVLTAYCDKHVPSDWENEHGTEKATLDAKEYYRRTMRGRRWADSQQAALSKTPSQHAQPLEPLDIAMSQPEGTSGGAIAAQRKKLLQAQKSIWRLPSGAPVVPQVVFNAVETSLGRFALRRRKEFVAEACKYWTLKREARRGAALLKRLQLQLETFSSTELTRRDFAAMGASGRPRLLRRKDMADMLLMDMDRIRSLCQAVKEREVAKLESAKVLQDVVNAVYLPLPALLQPIIARAQTLDNKRIFGARLFQLKESIDLALYASVAEFVRDLGDVFRSVVGGLDAILEVYNDTERSSLPSAKDLGLTPEQKDIKKVAKRIVKAVQQPLLTALHAEAELNETQTDKDTSLILELLIGQFDEPDLPNEDQTNGVLDAVSEPNHEMLINAQEPVQDSMNVTRTNEQPFTENQIISLSTDLNTATHLAEDVVQPHANGVSDESEAPLQGDQAVVVNGVSKPSDALPSSREIPAIKTELVSTSSAMGHGGIPWYLETFDPHGVTVHEERWTGREVLRSMSEDLSELDEEALNDLSMNVEDDELDVNGTDNGNGDEEDTHAAKKRKVMKKRRKRFPR